MSRTPSSRTTMRAVGVADLKNEFRLPRHEKGKLYGFGVRTPTNTIRALLSVNAGLGDRADQSQLRKIEGLVKVVLFEGGMRGFEPKEDSVVTAVDSQLAALNSNLEAYYDAWHKVIDSWVVIQVDDPNLVFQRRFQVINTYPVHGIHD